MLPQVVPSSGAIAAGGPHVTRDYHINVFYSEEDGAECLGLIPGQVRRLPAR